MPRTCPHCGARHLPDPARFCPRCGSAVEPVARRSGGKVFIIIALALIPMCLAFVGLFSVRQVRVGGPAPTMVERQSIEHVRHSR
jgi:hypothetical protein